MIHTGRVVREDARECSVACLGSGSFAPESPSSLPSFLRTIRSLDAQQKLHARQHRVLVRIVGRIFGRDLQDRRDGLRSARQRSEARCSAAGRLESEAIPCGRTRASRRSPIPQCDEACERASQPPSPTVGIRVASESAGAMQTDARRGRCSSLRFMPPTLLYRSIM